MNKDGRKIVITTDGKETLARLYKDGKVIKRATAKCNPKDTFDFGVGAKIAFDRLAEQEAYNVKLHDIQFKNGEVLITFRMVKDFPWSLIC